MPVYFDNDATLNIRNDNSELEQENMNYNIPSSKEVCGIELRMLPPLIKNNKTLSIWPFSGKADLYCFNMVLSDISNQLNGTIDLWPFYEVSSKEYLPISKTLYYWQENKTSHDSPNQIHIMTSILKSKEQLRDVGAIMSNIKKDTGYKSVMDNIGSIIAETVSFTMIANAAMELASIVGEYLGKIDDKPIGTVINSFTRLRGDWDQIGVNKILMQTKNIDFNYELIIREV